MAIIRVYRYKIFNDEQGAFMDTKVVVYATTEKIVELGAARIESAYLDIDDSQLNEAGFYHPR